MNPWTDLGDGIRVRQSRAYWMNSGLLLHPEHTVLVDPGVLPSELEDLAAVVGAVRPRQLSLVFTHSHWDHVLGRSRWPGAGTVGHPALGEALWRGAFTVLDEARRCADEAGEVWEAGFEPFDPDHPVGDAQELELGPWSLRFHAAPGHCDDQLAVHLPSHRLLFAADLLSDLEIPWLDRAPALYRRTLESLRAVVSLGGVGTLVPGHGAIAQGARAALDRIGRDLDYLQALEDGVRAARAAGFGVERVQRELAAMDYVGKGAAYPMDDVHRENVRLAWEAAGPAAD